MKTARILLTGILLWLITPSAIYACPGCAQAIAESGGSNGIIAIYSILAGMPFLIIGSVIVGFIIMKRKSSPNTTEQTKERFEHQGGNEN
ncbi:MAG: hypothetical protein IIB39_09940 [Candidatus Marinimicrobia bacterium]|nr:hypothetical protein [Candidatus Neomarinimicrobiota bacterium]